MLNPRNGQGRKLYEAINDYRTRILGMISDPEQASIINHNLATEIPKGKNNLGKNWQQYMFENTPAAAAVTLLSKLQSDVRYAEGVVLHTLVSNIDVKDIRVNELSAFVIPNSNTIVQGGKFSAHIIMAAGLDPTVMIGGTLPLLHAGYRVGQGDTIILESCEYCNSFLSFFPTVAVILNVEEDHLDFFKDLTDIQHSFRRFAELVPPAGSVIVNADNASAMEAVAGLEHPIFTFGLDHTADCTAANLTEVDGRPVFDVMIRGEKYARVELHVYGHHNVLNALAAASAAWALGLPGHAVETGLASFTGAGRRFEHKGTYHGAEVYDDYAHHPDELHALFTTAKEMGYERLVVAFQPHTYSRTAKLFERFVEELKIPDVAILAEIFAAREQNTLGISSADLCRNIPGAVYCSTLDKAAAALRQAARPGDLILTVGAGDIYRAGEKLLAGV